MSKPRKELSAKEIAAIDPRLLSLNLSIFSSRADRAGGQYHAFTVSVAGRPDLQVSATVTGTPNNIRQAEFYLRNRWPYSVEPRWYVTEQELPIRRFDQMVKAWEHAGCSGDEILKFIVARLPPAAPSVRDLQIKKWLRRGHHRSEAHTVAELLEEAGNAMDGACTHDIMGDILFEGSDGKTYVGTVEFVIAEANPKYVKEVLDGQ